MGYKCLKCDETFENIDDMMKHLDSEHGIPSYKARLGVDYSSLLEEAKAPSERVEVPPSQAALRLLEEAKRSPGKAPRPGTREFEMSLRGVPEEMRDESWYEGAYGLRVKDLEKIPDLTFLSDSQDVQHVKKYVGGEEVLQYDSFFVKTEAGEYTEIWGMEGIVPTLEKRVYRVKTGLEDYKVPTRPSRKADIYLKPEVTGYTADWAMTGATLAEILDSEKYAVSQITDPTTKRLVASEFVHSLNRKGLVPNEEVDGLIKWLLGE